MERVMQSMLLAIITLFLSQASMANGPTPIYVFCSDFLSISSDEGFFGSGDFCYKIEVSCDGDVSGGFLFGEVDPEGNVHGHMQSVAGPPGPVGPDVPSCVLHWFDHWHNSKFEHSCSYEGIGKFELETKLVPLNKCELD